MPEIERNICFNNPVFLNCMYFNACSIVNRLSDLEILVKTVTPDITAISESGTITNQKIQIDVDYAKDFDVVNHKKFVNK